MGRTVAFSQRAGVPDWFELGKRQLSEAKSPPKEYEAQGKSATPGARTVQRFARLARFLKEHHPTYFSGTVPLQAGSAAVQELMKIHQLQPEVACRLAPGCLNGHITVTQLHQELTRLLAVDQQLDTSRQGSSRWSASFKELAITRIGLEPILPDANLITEVQVVRVRTALVPDLVARHGATNRIIAIDISAPRDTAARSVANVAASLIARIATLRLHFDDAVLVLPVEATHIASATIDLWRDWVNVRESRWSRIDILVLGQTSHQLVSGKSARSGSSLPSYQKAPG